MPGRLHHDAGPNNVVFQKIRPIALIDFDMIAPGEPLEDIGYMAWTWCISSKPERGSPTRQAAQLRVLSDAYGLEATDRHRLVDSILERKIRNARFWGEILLSCSGSLAEKIEMEKRAKWSEAEWAYTASNRKVFADALA